MLTRTAWAGVLAGFVLVAAGACGGDTTSGGGSGGSAGAVDGTGGASASGGSSGSATTGGKDATGGTGGSNGGSGGAGAASGGGSGPQAGSGGAKPDAGSAGSAAAGSGNAGAPDPGGVSYAKDVAPIFEGSCVYCHYTGSLVMDIEDPFAATTGLVSSDNTWAIAHPEGNTPAKNVVPGDPEQSFLFQKITDMAIDAATAGNFMPWQVPRLTETEVTAIRQWITDGAKNDDTFTTTIRPIIGTEGKLAGKCIHCHRAGGQTPNLSDPFDPTTGAVGVKSKRVDLNLIEPGDPDNSFLVTKVTETSLPVALGRPMPANFPALTSDEVDVIRAWVEQGAKDN